MRDPHSGGDRRIGERRSPHTYIDADGTLIFGDRYGVMWRVYDRRGGDRRADASRPAEPGHYRAFVNEVGEEWRCALRGDDIIDETAIGLEDQLGRASLHDESAAS